MNPFLTKIVNHKKIEIEVLYQNPGYSYFQNKANQSHVQSDFYAQLATPGLQLIAELKKASPSKGLICKSFDPLMIAKSYTPYAAALSILTETDYFLGSPDYVSLVSSQFKTPILRKDFIVDPIQVYEAKVIGASAILLIKALLSERQCINLIQLATECELDVLMEVHTKSELESVLSLPSIPRIIGINNRDLKTFDVDVSTVLTLSPQIRQVAPDTLIVAESGYQHIEQLQQLSENNIDAVLIGEGLVTNSLLLDYWKKENEN